MNTWWFLLYLPLVFTHFSCLVNAQPFDYPVANLSTTWTNSLSDPNSLDFEDGSTVRPVFLRGPFGPRYACGFFCNGNCDTYLFAIFIVLISIVSYITSPSNGFPQVVWSANRNKPVRINATLQFTSDGDLVLRDADGTLAWSTSASGKSVTGLNLTDMGNLVLFDENNATVWQSFDYPTDLLVPGKKLVAGQKLRASVSATNTQGGLISLSVTSEGLVAFIQSNPPQAYYGNTIVGTKLSNEPSYNRFLNGSLALFILSAERSLPDAVFSILLASPGQHMRLEPDGHLRVYEWASEGIGVTDLLTGYLGECYYPLACGNYGICSKGQCSCPASTSGGAAYFKQINDRKPDLGCLEITPLSCEVSQYHSFLELKDVTSSFAQTL